MTPRLVLYGAAACLALTAVESIRSSDRASGAADEAEKGARAHQHEMVTYYKERRRVTWAYADSLAVARQSTRAALARVRILSATTVAIDGVTVSAPAALIDIAQRCAQMELATGNYVISVAQQEVAGDSVFAADTVLTNATKQNRPGWLRRTWEAVDGPVMLAGGLVIGVAIGAHVRPP